MSNPIFSVKHVQSEALLPKNLIIGRAYFIADEQIIIIDHGDGRGPVRYGGKPGPQGIAGEPIPSLQRQIDELSNTSVLTTATIHELNMQNKADFEHIHKLIQDNISLIKSQNDDNAKAILLLLTTVKEKFFDYDNALNILAKAISNFYPASHGATSGDCTNSTPKGIITTEDGTSYKIENAYTQGDTGVVVLTLYDEARVNTLSEGDTVQLDDGYFIVNTLDNDSGVISVTLYTA